MLYRSRSISRGGLIIMWCFVLADGFIKNPGGVSFGRDGFLKHPERCSFGAGFNKYPV